MSEFLLHISTPERMFFNQKVESLIISSIDGELGVLAGHEPLVVAMATGPVSIRIGEEWRVAALSGGFAEINPEEVVILADSAEWPEEIETNRALEAKRRAEERLQEHLSEIEYMRSRAALERALLRIKLARK